MEQQLRDEDIGSSPMGLLRSESRFWLQARPLRGRGGGNLLPWGPGLCPYRWGDDPPQLYEDTQRAGTSLRASVHPHSSFRNNLFFSKAWDFDLGGVFSSCWSPDVLPASPTLHPPPPKSMAHGILVLPQILLGKCCSGKGGRTWDLGTDGRGWAALVSHWPKGAHSSDFPVYVFLDSPFWVSGTPLLLGFPPPAPS